MKNLKVGLALVLLSTIIFTSCRKKDGLALADNFVVFENSAQGILAAENTITVKLKLLSPTNTDIPVIINVAEQGVAYTTNYTTLPATIAGKISITIPSGSNEASFTITKNPTSIFAGDEKLIFSLYSSGAPVFLGVTKQFTLSFAELIASNYATTINGGGATFGNKVFIDISGNKQTAIQRTNWDLNFYNGADDFKVLLNSSTNMMAKQINKTDLNTVSTADTIGFTTDVSFSQFAPLTTSLPYIDYPNGDLTRTAISTIAATATDNKVYIVNRGSVIGTSGASRGWKKIRIIRNASGGYTIQHADIAATTFSSVDINKDATTFYKQFSFENGTNITEPLKKKWDFAWTYFANVTNLGGGEVPYMFQDAILLNKDVQVAKVLTATKTFDNFLEADLASITFLSAQNAIATDWRSGGGPTSAPAVRTDRFYIIKDSDNNYYKLRFTSLTQNAERGFPSYDAVLVKRG